MARAHIVLPDTVSLDEQTHELVIIDQTLLPGKVRLLRLHDPEDIYEAVCALRVRGAPAIGVAAAIGIYAAARRFPETDYAAFAARFEQVRAYLVSARPTAVNLAWALERMAQVIRTHKGADVPQLLTLLHDRAVAIRDEDVAVCRAIGEHGAPLLADVEGVLTHCNAGRLAAVRYGTALAPVYIAGEQGNSVRVYSDETRPLLQGARLTAWELHAAGVAVTTICDNMASVVMKEGRVQAVLVGCDRVAANGDAANKIGTSGVAILARHYGIPFYVCAPLSTVDMACPHGGAIPVEQRDPREITEQWYEKPMVPAGIGVYNPAFDVTEADLITAFITEKGVIYPPFGPAFRQLFEKKEEV